MGTDMRVITRPQRETLHRLYLSAYDTWPPSAVIDNPRLTYREFRRTALVLKPSPIDQIIYKIVYKNIGGQVLVDIGPKTYGIELDGYAHT